MDAERDSDLRLRAALHGALSDPSRLTIVDMLSLGDLSPSELQKVLGLPSNLLAHHLKVLEEVGIVTRTRSEGDRRRSYLRLIPSSLDTIMAGAHGVASRIVFVCTANSARSQIAAALWRHTSNIPAASAGTRPAERINPGAVAVASRHQLPLPRRRPVPLHDVLADDDFVVTVCDNAHEELSPLGTLHWSIPDPVPLGSDAAFDAVFDELTRRVANLAPRLTTS
jgi:protein-tyrosine-phosphatase/DNA-binding transcriptional ArsR family regulator